MVKLSELFPGGIKYPEFDPDVSYGIDDMISRNGLIYVSEVDNNKGNVPESSPSEWSEYASSDESVKVSDNDTAAGYLADKLVAGTGISLAQNNDGGDETLTVSATSSGGGDSAQIITTAADLDLSAVQLQSTDIILFVDASAGDILITPPDPADFARLAVIQTAGDNSIEIHSRVNDKYNPYWNGLYNGLTLISDGSDIYRIIEATTSEDTSAYLEYVQGGVIETVNNGPLELSA